MPLVFYRFPLSSADIFGKSAPGGPVTMEFLERLMGLAFRFLVLLQEQIKREASESFCRACQHCCRLHQRGVRERPLNASLHCRWVLATEHWHSFVPSRGPLVGVFLCWLLHKTLIILYRVCCCDCFAP